MGEARSPADGSRVFPLALAVLVAVALSILAMLVRSGSTQEVAPNGPLPMRTYLIGEPPLRSELRLEVATTPEQQRRGLMGRDAVTGDGMAFPREPSPAGFWMRGTRIPLDIAYVGPDGRIESIVQGRPFDETILPSRGAVSLVIEVPAGKARLYGMKPGASVRAVPARPTEPDGVAAKP